MNIFKKDTDEEAVSRRQPGKRAANGSSRPAKRTPGKREMNKSQKLARIAKATKQVVAKNGFDATTMQEIAKIAKVAVGTLFLYADNKRDLAFLAMKDDFDTARRVGLEVAPDLPLDEQIVAMFTPYFHLLADNREIARIILSEFHFFSGTQARQHADSIAKSKLVLSNHVLRAQERGTVTRIATPEEVANLVYQVYQGVVRQWIQNGAAAPTDGISQFRRTITILFEGLRERSSETPA